MTLSPLASETQKRLRGVILELVNEGHEAQSSRLTDVTLWSLLQRLKYDVSQNGVITTLQDLQERGYLKFQQEKDRRTGVVRISQIQIAPAGRDLLEGTRTDAAIIVLL